MAQTEMLKRYLDAGVAFTQMTQRRAEEIVRDLVRAGELQSADVQQRVNELVSQSRENTERLLEIVRQEIRDQAGSLGLATKADVEALRREIAGLRGAGSAKKTAAKKTAAKKTPAKKTAAKKAPAKKAAAKRSPAKKAAAAKKR